MPVFCWRQLQDWFKLTGAEMEAYLGPLPLVPETATWLTEKAKDKDMTYLYGKNWKKLYE